MPNISFSPEDLASTNKLEAGWYKLLVKSIEEGPGKKDPTSTTYSCEFVVVEPVKVKDTPIPHWFSDKMMVKAVIFIKCFVKSIEAGKQYPLESTVGKHVMGYCQWDMENTRNIILDFKPVATAAV